MNFHSTVLLFHAMLVTDPLLLFFSQPVCSANCRVGLSLFCSGLRAILRSSVVIYTSSLQDKQACFIIQLAHTVQSIAPVNEQTKLPVRALLGVSAFISTETFFFFPRIIIRHLTSYKPITTPIYLPTKNQWR
jgi:hypothetical protein